MFIPSEGDIMTVKLPNETVRATVVDVINKNTVVALLDQAYPFTRLHGYSFGDKLRFRRHAAPLVGEEWRVEEAVQRAPRQSEGKAKPRIAPPDQRDVKPVEAKIAPKKAKRRSDIEAEKPKKRIAADG